MARLWMVANEKEFESEINDFLMSSAVVGYIQLQGYRGDLTYRYNNTVGSIAYCLSIYVP